MRRWRELGPRERAMVVPHARVCLVILGFLALALGALATIAAAQTPPPASGDWVVADDTVLAGQSIVVRGGLTVASTGRLTLTDVDLEFACQTRQPGILVEGELIIKDRDGDPASMSDATFISNADPEQDFNLTYADGSKGSVSCSLFKSVSIHVLAKSMVVTDSTIGSGRIGGIEAKGCDLKLEGTNFLKNLFWGVRVEGGSLRMDRCDLNDSVPFGLVLSSDVIASVHNCTFQRTSVVGIKAVQSKVLVEDCDFAQNLIGISLADLTDCVLRRCDFHGLNGPEGSGLYAIDVDRLSVSSCHFHDLKGMGASLAGTAIEVFTCVFLDIDGGGASLSGTANSVSSCVFDRIGGTGADLSGSALIAQCDLTRCRTGINIVQDQITVLECDLQDCYNGIVVKNPGGRMATIEGCIINGSLCDLWAEGASGMTANVSMRDCEITNSGAYGVYAIEASVDMRLCNVSRCLNTGIAATLGSSAFIGNCTISWCNEFGVGALGSTVTVEWCNITGAGIGCNLYDGAHGTIRRCNFDDCLAGVAFNGTVEFEDSVVDACVRGAIIGDGPINVTRCRFSSCGMGVWASGIRGAGVAFEDCTFVGSRQEGVQIWSRGGDIVRAVLRNCTVERSGTNGVLAGDGGRCVLVDPRLSDNGEHGVYCAVNGTVEWIVEAYSSSDNEVSNLRGNVTVRPGGTLELTNATLQFVNEGRVMYGISVDGGTLVMADLDGDPSTRGDASRIRGEEGYHPDYLTSYISVTGGGVLDASCSRFTNVPVTVEGGRLELSGCAFEAWMNGCIDLRNSSGTSVVRGCDFMLGAFSIMAWNSPLDIDDCFMNSNVCIEAHECDSISITRTTLRGWYMSLLVDVSAKVDLEGLTILEAEMGVTMNDVDDLSITDTVIAGCYGWGLSLLRCNATIAASSVRDTGTGIWAENCVVIIDGLAIRGCAVSGLRTLESTLTVDGLRVNETSIWATELLGGTVELTDSYLDSLGDVVLLAILDAVVRCYNTTIEGLRTEVGADAVVEMYHQVRVTATLKDGRRPPATLWIALTSAQGARALTMPLGRAATTGWVWLEQLAITANGTVWHTPYTAEVSLGGRSVSQDFDVRGRTDVIIELRHDVIAAISAQGEVREGTETTIEGNASSSWPFDIASLEWDIGYDGVFSPDGWGERLWWTFGANGTYKVALRATDEAGLRDIRVTEVTVLDAGPSVTIVPPPPGSVLEDELIQMDGRVASPADVVEYIAWDLGDGRVVEGRAPFVSWPRAGTYVVTFTAVDMDGSRATANATMTVVNQPPVAVMPRVRLEAARHAPFVLDGSRSHDTPSDMASLAFEWVVEGVGTLAGVRPNVTFDAVGEFRVTLTVADDDGASSSAVMTVVVVNSPPRVGRLDDISVRQTDRPMELALGSRVTDPDDDARNITIRATSSRPDLVSVYVRRLGDGTYILTMTPIGTGDASGRAVVTVTATDRDGGTAEGAFNVTLLKVPKARPEATPSWVYPSLGLSLVLVLVAVVLLLSWARARRAGPSDGAS